MSEKREAPNNIEAEQALLGAILTDNRTLAQVSKFLQAGHFHEPLHRLIYTNITTMIGLGKQASPVTIKPFLPVDEKIGDLTLGQYLVRLVAESVTLINAGDFGAGIHDMHMRRQLVGIGEWLTALAYDAPIDMSPQDIIEEAYKRLGELAAVDSLPYSTKSRIGDRYLEEIRAAKLRQAVIGVPIAFDELAAVLSEPVFETGNLYGLLSSSGEGKTSFMLQVAYGAIKQGHPVLIQSYDQYDMQFMRQLVAQNFSIEAKRQRYGDLGDKEAEVEEFALWLQSSRLLKVEKCAKETAAQLVEQVRAWKRDFIPRNNDKTPLVLTDHAGAVTPPESTARSDEGKKALAVAGELKTGAGRHQVSWLFINQRNSKGMSRDNPRPIRSDMYGGESSLQPYDAIAYLYRFRQWFLARKAITVETEAELKKRFQIFPRAVIEETEDIAELGAVKVRFGDPGIRKQVNFQGKFTRYVSTQPPPADPEQYDQLGFGGL